MQFITKMKSALLVAAALFSFNAFAEVETQEGQSPTKNEDFVGTCFTVPGTFIPGGTGNGNGHSGLKFRTNQEGSTLLFNVNEGYVITNFAAEGASNYAPNEGIAADEAFITVTKVEVDGAEVAFTGGKFPCKDDANGTAQLEISNIKAKQSIKLYFENTNVSGNQVVISYAITYAAAAAEEPAAVDFADGKYYIQDVATGKYLAAGHDWGTRAIVSTAALDWGLTKVEEGVYTLDSQVSNGGESHFLGTNGYTDAGAANWTIAKADAGYTIQGDPGYLTIDGSDNIAFTAEAGDATQWNIIAEADAIDALLASFAGATAENPVEATLLIKDANFNRNDLRSSAWTMEASNQNLSGGNNTNNCAESWQSAFTLSQKINLPNGQYKVTAQATLTDYTNAYDGAEYPVVYANDVTSVFNSMDESDRGTNMSTLSESFTAGKYYVEPLIVDVTDGTLTIGVKGTRTNTWCIWDNFQLFRIGDVDMAKILAGNQEAYNKALEAALAAAKEDMADSYYEALEAAIAANKNVDMESVEALQAATAALNDATAQAQASINSYKILFGEAEIADNSLAGWTCTNANTFHINTWSVEGNPGNDPSGMVTPFVENWVGAPGPLGEGDITYTMAGVEPGEYTVKALVRIYSESGAEPAGANFFVGNNSVDMAADGTNFVYNNMKGIYGTYIVSGTVGEDGVLKFGVNISNPTFNWVAIKNVEVMEGTPAEKLEETREIAINLIPFTSDPDLQTELALALNKTANLKTPAAQLEGIEILKPIVAEILIQNGYAEEPEKEVAEGWKSVITNGNLASSDTSSYSWQGSATGNDGIKNGIGNYGSRGIKVTTADSHTNGYETQFFIRANQSLPVGTKIRIEFDCKAKFAASVNTQAHSEPGSYLGWNSFGNVNFDTEWSHFTVEYTSDNDALQTFAIDLGNSDSNVFYFDNILFWIQEPDAASKGATGIESVEAGQANDVIFNLNGQKVQNVQKGLFIKNGKKVILK